MFNDSEDRRSDDCTNTIDYLKWLINREVIAIDDVLVFFNYACGAYKQACIKTGMTDSKINIEFNYAARAFAAYMHNDNENQIDKKLALLDAFQASRHIINDSLDIILGEIERLIASSEHISESKGFEDYISDYDDLVLKKEKIYDIVANSRRKRGIFRYESYLEIIHGESYNELLDFLSKIKHAIPKLVKEREKEQKANRKNLFIFTFGVFLTIAIALFADGMSEGGKYIIGLVANMIEDIKGK